MTIAMTIKVIEIEMSPYVVESATIAIRPWNVVMFGINAAANILTTGQCDLLSRSQLASYQNFC
jgi:hypothetical protein